MSSKAWPKVKPVTKNGKRVFLLDARIKGVGERTYHKTRAEADGEALKLRVRRQNEGTGAFEDAELASFGLTVADAIKFTLEHYRRQSASVSVSEAVRLLVETKEKAGFAAEYCNGLRTRLTAFASTVEGKTLAEITTPVLDDFLSGLSVAPATRNTFRRDLRTLWSFGSVTSRKWCAATIAKETAKAKTGDLDVEVLTVHQTARLLESCDDEIVPAVVIAAFCGLRQSEVAELDWKDIDLAESVIQVTAKIAKTDSRRSVTIPANAVEWLRPFQCDAGAVTPANFRNQFDRARVRAGFRPSFEGRKDAELQKLLEEAAKEKTKLADWPKNCLRHGAISYKLALSKNISMVATESGNSPKVIKTHYLNLVKPSAAVSYYEIKPVQDGKVTRMAA